MGCLILHRLPASGRARAPSSTPGRGLGPVFAGFRTGECDWGTSVPGKRVGVTSPDGLAGGKERGGGKGLAGFKMRVGAHVVAVTPRRSVLTTTWRRRSYIRLYHGTGLTSCTGLCQTGGERRWPSTMALYNAGRARRGPLLAARRDAGGILSVSGSALISVWLWFDRPRLGGPGRHVGRDFCAGGGSEGPTVVQGPAPRRGTRPPRPPPAG